MRKTISTILMFLLAATPVLGATTLWNYFVDEQGIKMPTVEERTPMAERCGISHYRGTYEQNIEFLECLQRERSETISEPIGGPMFGSTYPVASGWHYLAGSGIGTSDTSITLRSLKTRDGREITMSNFGTIGYATIEPGSLDKFEIISFTGISQDPNSDEATLTGVSRGIDVLYPYNASSSLAKSHSGGSYLIFSDPPSLYAFYANRNNDESIWGDWTYSATNTPQYNVEPTLTNDLEFAYKGYVDSVATSGAPDALENTKGLVELATREELNSSSATGTSGAYLVAQVQHFSTSSSATTVVPVTGSDGKLSAGFIATSPDYTWTGNNTFSGNNIYSGTSTFTGNITSSGEVTFNSTTTFNSAVYGMKGIFGNGSDGDVTLNSSTTLTRDMFYNNLTVSNDVVLKTNNYRIFVRDTLTNNGIIDNSGADGTTGGATTTAAGNGSLRGGGYGGKTNDDNPSSGSGGAGGGVIFIAARIIDNANGIIRANGGDGGDSVACSGANAGGKPGESVSCGLGGDGGNGGAAGTSPLSGGTVTTASSTPTNLFVGFTGYDAGHNEAIGGGAGGGAGRRYNDNCNAGGGGGGGTIWLYYETATWGTEEANGGTGGTSVDGDNGEDGSAGSIYKVQILN